MQFRALAPMSECGGAAWECVMGEFILIGGDEFEYDEHPLDDAHDMIDAQDAMAELNILQTTVWRNDSDDNDPKKNVDTGRVLTSRVFVVIPYTKQYSDDHGAPVYAIVRARSAEHATELVADGAGCGLIDDEAFWSREANEKGDTVESAGDGCFYHMWSCDCGDEGCGVTDRETNPIHESQTETILFRFDESTVHATREAAIESRQGQTPAVEYLDT